MAKRKSTKKTSQRIVNTSPSTATSRLLTNKWVNIDVVTTYDPNKGRIKNLRHNVHEAIANNPVVSRYRKYRRLRNTITSPRITATVQAKNLI